MGPVRVDSAGAASCSSAAGVGNATTKLSRYRSPCSSAAAGLKLRLTPKKGPVAAGGCARIRSRTLPPATRVSLHTYFFIASCGATQIPPVSLQPGEPAIVTSIPEARARRVVARKVARHWSPRKSTGGSMTCGSPRPPPVNVWTPPIPIRCIQARSSFAPSRLTLPFIQCHQTCGRAASGGWRNPASKASGSGAAACAVRTQREATNPEISDFGRQACAGCIRHAV